MTPACGRRLLRSGYRRASQACHKARLVIQGVFRLRALPTRSLRTTSSQKLNSAEMAAVLMADGGCCIANQEA